VESAIYAGSRPVLRENFLLQPGRNDLTAMARMSEYSYLASLYVVQEGRPAAFWRRLEDQLTEIAGRRTRHGVEVWGASTLATEGVMVRGLSRTGCFVNEALVEFWRAARLTVTGAEALPPRKIY
jgi:urease accessory protein UreH